jgi:hypothetical protein
MMFQEHLVVSAALLGITRSLRHVGGYEGSWCFPEFIYFITLKLRLHYQHFGNMLGHVLRYMNLGPFYTINISAACWDTCRRDVVEMLLNKLAES